MSDYKLKHRVIFDEETHTYWPTQEKLDAMNARFEKYKGDMNKVEYFRTQGFREEKLVSTTQLLSKVFPFTMDLKGIKNWVAKVAKKDTTSEIYKSTILHLLRAIDKTQEVLDYDVKLAQDLGTEAHSLIQEFIEWVVKGENTMKAIASGNIYFNNFFGKYILPDVEDDGKIYDNELTTLINGIEEILPCETPVGYWDEDQYKYLYTGMWDGLYKMNDGKFALIDIKTGSETKGDKKLKVEHQLNAYNNLVKNNLGIEVDRHICIAIANVYNNKTQEWEVKLDLIEFEPKPESFFNMMSAYEILETIKGGK